MKLFEKYIVDTGILSYDFKIVIYHIVLDDCASFITVIISSMLGQEIMDSVYFSIIENKMLSIVACRISLLQLINQLLP